MVVLVTKKLEYNFITRKESLHF